MDLEADAMPEAVAEPLAQTGGLDRVACRRVRVASPHPGANRARAPSWAERTSS